MKNLKILSAILTTALILTLTFASCGGGGGGSGPAPALPAKEPQKTIYRSADAEGNVYRLAVTEKVAGRAAYAPQKGDTYVLTIFWKEEGKGSSTSSGTVETAGGTLTLKPTVAPTVTFTITISGSGLTAISGTITFDPENDKAAETKVISTPITLTVKPLTEVDNMDLSLAAKLANTPATAYSYKLKIYNNEFWELLDLLGKYSNKYVKLDLSESSLEGWGFWECETLVSIILPNNLTTIHDDYVFVKCINLSSVTIPDSVTIIGEGAFLACTSLTSVTIGKGVTNIGELAFAECTSLANITIPDSVKTIENMAFFKCTSLTSITIPASVISIGKDGDNGGTFQGTSLTSVTFKRAGIELLGDWLPFPGDLGDKYREGGAGTYTRPNRDDEEWTKK